jgi:hypothetical protein
MQPGSLTIGRTNSNFGGATSGFSTNTSGLLLECLDNTEITGCNSGKGINPLLDFNGGNLSRNSVITIGRNAEFGASEIILVVIQLVSVH